MKKKFLDALKRYLTPLNPAEREEIIRFYEERFHTGMMYEGKSEQDIIDELEQPREIARNVLREYGYTTKHLHEDYQKQDKKTPKEQSYKQPQTVVRGKGINVFSVVFIILFDVFFVTWFVPLLFSILFGASGGFLGLVYGFLTQTEIIRGSSMLLNFIFYTGIMILWLGFILWMYDVIVTFVGWLVRWHLDVFGFNGRNLVRFINGLKINRFFRKRPGLRRLKGTLMTLAVIFVIVGGTTLFLRTGSLAFNTDAHELSEVRYEETGNGGLWRIESDLDLGDLKVLKHSSSDIVVVSNEREDVPVDVSIDLDNFVIRVENTMERRFTINFIFSVLADQPEVVIYLPSDIMIESLELVSINGSITTHNIQATSASIETTNGGVRLYDLELSETLTIKTLNGSIRLDRTEVLGRVGLTTTNGNIQLNQTELGDNLVTTTTNGNHTLSHVTGQAVMTSSTNGSVSVNSSRFTLYEFRTTNGGITLKNLNDTENFGQQLKAQSTNGTVRLDDVYIDDIDLRTTNGGIRYHNAEASFEPTRLRVSTEHGSKDISVREN